MLGRGGSLESQGQQEKGTVRGQRGRLGAAEVRREGETGVTCGMGFSEQGREGKEQRHGSLCGCAQPDPLPTLCWKLLPELGTRKIQASNYFFFSSGIWSRI